MNKASNALLALSRAFYGKRLSQKQYNDLLSCKSINEVASYLKNRTVYGDAFSAVGTADFSAKTLENVIDESRFGKFISLCRYELAIGSEFYKYFIVKTEVEQILKCTLHMIGGNAGGYLMQMNAFVDKHLSIDLYALGKAESLEQIAASLENTRYETIYKRCLADPERSYLTFELAFNTYFENFKDELVEHCFTGKEKSAMRDMVCRSFDVSFIEKQFRIVRYYKSNNAVTKLAMPASVSLTLFSEKQLRQLYACQSEAELVQVLRKSPYKDCFGKGAQKDIERQITQDFYQHCKKQIRFSSYPSVVMYSYLFLSGIERNNLVRIIEGIKYKVPTEQISESLLGVGD